MEIIIDNVEVMMLREKIAAYKTLFDKSTALVEVQGTFRDKNGELVFLSRGGFCPMESNATFRRHSPSLSMVNGSK